MNDLILFQLVIELYFKLQSNYAYKIKTKFKCIIAFKSGYNYELRPKFIGIIAFKVVIFLN